MFTYQDALKKAQEYLDDSEIPLQITKEGEFACGWFFFFQSAEFLRTADPSDQLAGNCPFLIDRNTGELVELGTAEPLESYLKRYTALRSTSLPKGSTE
jgi:hypothetical protein